MPKHRPEIVLLLQPWSTAASQAKNTRIAQAARILSNMYSILREHGEENTVFFSVMQGVAVTRIT